jgi:hypothetical protein
MLRRVSSAGIVVLCLCFAAFMGVGTAHAKEKGHNCPNPAGKYPPGQCKFVTSTDAGPPGTKVKVGGAGYSKNNTVTLSMHSAKAVVLGTFHTDSSGAWGGTVVIPSGAATGQHELSASDMATGFTQVQSFRVTNPSGVKAASLPFTGFIFWPLLGGGIALVVVGTALTMAGRRRRNFAPITI